MMWPRIMLHQFQSNQNFARLAKKNFRLTTLSNTSEKRTWSETTETKRYCSGLEKYCGGGKGR